MLLIAIKTMMMKTTPKTLKNTYCPNTDCSTITRQLLEEYNDIYCQKILESCNGNHLKAWWYKTMYGFSPAYINSADLWNLLVILGAERKGQSEKRENKKIKRLRLDNYIYIFIFWKTPELMNQVTLSRREIDPTA